MHKILATAAAEVDSIVETVAGAIGEEALVAAEGDVAEVGAECWQESSSGNRKPPVSLIPRQKIINSWPVSWKRPQQSAKALVMNRKSKCAMNSGI